MTKRLLLSVVLPSICTMLIACSGSENEAPTAANKAPSTTTATTTTPKEAKTEVPVAGDISSYLDQKIQGISKKTSPMVDALSKLAKADAKNVSEAKIAEAINWIKSHHNSLFADDKTMEIAIYYGSLLDAAFNDQDPRSQIGWNTVKAVKYVYRGAEKQTDAAPQKALKKIQATLGKL
jgi:hypothetical protein